MQRAALNTAVSTELRIGTRDSALALWQANWVGDELVRLGYPIKIVPITTLGDHDQTSSISGAGEPGVFTKSIQEALLHEEIDLAVHSLKDLPTLPVDGLRLAAVPRRASRCDVLV